MGSYAAALAAANALCGTAEQVGIFTILVMLFADAIAFGWQCLLGYYCWLALLNIFFEFLLECSWDSCQPKNKLCATGLRT